MRGVRLILLHPEWASRSCADCQAWSYDDDGQRSTRGGKDQPRPPGSLTPCWKCPKIPDGTPPEERNPSSAVELDERNRRAWRHYLECRATLSFPDDDIVRRNAAILRGVEDEAERHSLSGLARSLARIGKGA